MSTHLWEVRAVPGGLTLELQAADDPALALAQGATRVGVEVVQVKGVVAALADGTADLAGAMVEGTVVLTEALGAGWQWPADRDDACSEDDAR